MRLSNASVGVGLHGFNGHQIHERIRNHCLVRWIGHTESSADVDPPQDACTFQSLDQMLADERVQIVSLCSRRRRDQAGEAIRCLQAGKHVLAEKPCAMTLKDLDQIVETSRRTGCHFQEMSNDVACQQPYRAIAEVIRDGGIGEVVQIFSQKSYPYQPWRPQNEDIDGGLLLQAGGHCLRMVEHVCDQNISELSVRQTAVGNPEPGQLKMACSMSMRLGNGGLATGIANYLNPPTFESWGNDHLRVFGTEGFVELVDGSKTRWQRHDTGRQPLNLTAISADEFFGFVDQVRHERPDIVRLERTLRPTRLLLEALASSDSREHG